MTTDIKLEPVFKRDAPNIVASFGHSMVGGADGVPGVRGALKQILAARGYSSLYTGTQNASGGQAELADTYGDDFRHDGYGGETTRDCANAFATRWDSLVALGPTMFPSVIMLVQGCNDVGSIGTTEAEYLSNYDYLMSAILDKVENIPILMVGTPPRVEGSGFTVVDDSQWTDLRRAEYKTAIKWNGIFKRGVRFVDSWNLISPMLHNHEGSSSAGCLSWFTETSSTRIHPNALMAMKWAHEIFQVGSGEPCTYGAGPILSSEVQTSFASNIDYPTGAYVQKQSRGALDVTTINGERFTLADGDLRIGGVYPVPVVRIHATTTTLTRAVCHVIGLDASGTSVPGSAVGSIVGGGGDSQDTCLSYHRVCTGSDEVLVSASARVVLGVDCSHVNDAPIWVKLYDKATAPAETDTPIWAFGFPAAATAALGGGGFKPFARPISLTNGLGLRVVKGLADNNDTPVDASEVVVSLQYGT